MPVSTKPPTRTIVPLISSVERKEGPNLSRRCSIRVPTKALRNALGVSSKVVLLRHTFFRGKACQGLRLLALLHELPFGQPTSFSFLHSRSTGVPHRSFSFEAPHACSKAGGALLDGQKISGRRYLHKPDRSKRTHRIFSRSLRWKRGFLEPQSSFLAGHVSFAREFFRAPD
jgi:hypothetical protein